MSVKPPKIVLKPQKFRRLELLILGSVFICIMVLWVSPRVFVLWQLLLTQIPSSELPATSSVDSQIIFPASQQIENYWGIDGIEKIVFRFDLNLISEMQIERKYANVDCPIEPLIIKDKPMIRDAVQRLGTARILPLAHEGPSRDRAYRIKLTLATFDLHYPYLSTYKKNTQGQQIDAVFLQLSPHSRNVFNGYSAPEFHEWLTQNIDPIFEECW